MGTDSGEVFQLDLRIRASFFKVIWNTGKDATEKKDIGVKVWKADSYFLRIRQIKIGNARL